MSTTSETQPSGPLAVIMAGGEGTRLRPFTHVIPKPLLPIGRRPVAQIIIERLREQGILDVVMTLEYGADLIRAYFRDGSQFDVRVAYHQEPRKLGTAGCLRDVPQLLQSTEPFLVTNGDVLTDLDYAGFLRRHGESGAALTVASRRERVGVRYGVLRLDGEAVQGVDEKPTFEFAINAGIYALSPSILKLIPAGREFPMTDLINAALAAGLPVRTEDVPGVWFDLSCTDDFDKAVAHLETAWPAVLA